MKTLGLRILAGLLLLWCLLWPLEGFLLPGLRKARAWALPSSPPIEARADPRLGQLPLPGWPPFPVLQDGERWVLFLEGARMDPAPERREERSGEFRNILARYRPGPFGLALHHLPQATTLQSALWLGPLPEGSIVILGLDPTDLERNRWSHWGALPLPRLKKEGGNLLPWLPARKDPSFPAILGSWIPLLRLASQEGLETLEGGEIPRALWPFLRGGPPGESGRYEATALALAFAKRKVEASKSRLVLLYLPSPLEWDSGIQGRCLQDLHLDSSRLESSRPSRRLLDLCQGLEIPYVNPLPALRQARRSKEPLFQPDPEAPLGSPYGSRARKIVYRTLARTLAPLLR